MRIASYNIHKAVGLDGRRDPLRILRVLRDLRADIVVLQEADRRLGQRPAALPAEAICGETDYRAVDHAGSDVSLGWHGNAILVRSGLTVDDVRRIELPALEPRGAVVARIGRLTVVGTHLGLLRSSRKQQMQAIHETLNSRAASALVAGDFNEWSARKGFEPWAGDFDIVRPGASFHARRPVARLDGFALGRDLAIETGGVFRRGEARVASDHLPVWIKLAAKHAEPDADGTASHDFAERT